MDEGEGTGVPPRCEAGGRSAAELCAADFAEEHGRPEADHRSSWPAGRDHTVVTCALTATVFSDLRPHSVGVNEAREETVRLVVRDVRWPVQLEELETTRDSSEAKVFRAHAPPQGACENLVCPLTLLANQQTEDDSLVPVLVEGHQEQSRLEMMDELTRFIKVDSHEAVTVGDS